MSDARRLMELGFTGPLAAELAEQIEAQDGARQRLVELGMTPTLAEEVAGQIDAAGTTDAPKLAAMAMVPEQAVELVAQIEADRA